jgi:hypothetical protein
MLFFILQKNTRTDFGLFECWIIRIVKIALLRCAIFLLFFFVLKQKRNKIIQVSISYNPKTTSVFRCVTRAARRNSSSRGSLPLHIFVVFIGLLHEAEISSIVCP